MKNMFGFYNEDIDDSPHSFHFESQEEAEAAVLNTYGPDSGYVVVKASAVQAKSSGSTAKKMVTGK